MSHFTLDGIEAATKIGGEFILLPTEPPIAGDVVLAASRGKMYYRLVSPGDEIDLGTSGGAGWTYVWTDQGLPDGVVAIGRPRCCLEPKGA